MPKIYTNIDSYILFLNELKLTISIFVEQTEGFLEFYNLLLVQYISHMREREKKRELSIAEALLGLYVEFEMGQQSLVNALNFR